MVYYLSIRIERFNLYLKAICLCSPFNIKEKKIQSNYGKDPDNSQEVKH